MNTKKTRQTNYDFMRILMSIFVMYIHSPKPERIVNIPLAENFLYIFAMQCNAIFFMLSGKFALNKQFNEKKDYVDYYISKFITLIIPYGITSCLLVLAQSPFTGIKKYILDCARAFINNPSSHLWFICTLIGFLLGAPFLSKMLNSMQKTELRILFSVGILWNICSVYLIADLRLQDPVLGWFLDGWIFVFIIGYLYDKIFDEKHIRWVYLIGVLGLVASAIGKTYLPVFEYPASQSVAFIVFVIASFIFLERHMNFTNPAVCHVIRFLAPYSYIAYIVHYFIKTKLEAILTGRGMSDSLLFVTVVFILSYLTAIIVSELLIKPIQKMLFRLNHRAKS